MPTNASGLPFYLGCFAHSPDRVLRHQSKIGRKVTCLQVSPTRGSWAAAFNTWWMAKPAGFTGIYDVAVPLWQADGNLATAAAGGYDTHWERLGKLLHDAAPGSLIRPGWEFNLDGWDHHANTGNVAQWREAFRRAYTAIKRGGPSVMVEWNPNAGGAGPLSKVEDAWPGDGYVDVVGLDSYDWWPPYTSDTAWAKHRDEYGGWKHWVDFARAHGKLFAVPEFGLAPGNSNGGGDNPKFFQYVMPFLAQHRDILYMASYFDEPASYIRNSIGDGQVPLGAAEYKRQLDVIAAMGTPTPPPTPTPLTVTAAETAPGEVTVTWTPAVQATVSRDGVDTTGSGAWTDTATGTYAFKLLRPGDQYTFTVKTATATATAKATIAGPIPDPEPEPEPAPEMVTLLVQVPKSWLTAQAPTQGAS